MELKRGYKALDALMKFIRPRCFNYYSEAGDYEMSDDEYAIASELFDIVHDTLTGEQAHDYVKQNYD